MVTALAGASGERDSSRRRRHRLRPGRCRPRPGAGVREDPGRLQLLLLVLRHPAGARRVAQPDGRRGARRGSPPGRAGPPRGRADRDQPRLLPRSRAPATTYRGSFARPEPIDRPRPPATLLRRGQPRRATSSCERCARRRAVSPAPARPAPVRGRRRAAGDGPSLHGVDLPAPARARRGVQPHDRRDRRLSRQRTSGPSRPTLEIVERAGITKVHVFPVLAAARDAHGGRATRSRPRSSASAALGCGEASHRRLPRAPGDASSGSPDRRARRPARPRVRRRLLAVARRGARRRLPARDRGGSIVARERPRRRSSGGGVLAALRA